MIKDEYIIKTDRLVLRPLGIEDLETVHSYASDIDNTRYMMHLPKYTKEETENFLLNVTAEWEKEYPEYYEFAVTINNIQIGAVSVYLNSDRTIGELGWILNKCYWSKGYATEAALALKEFAVKLGIHKLVAHCDYKNAASYAVMKKIGLELEDDTKERIYPKTMEVSRELMCSLVCVK